MHDEYDRKGDPETLKWWSELENKPLAELSPCCRIIIESGLEALQWSDFRGVIHNMFISYCPQCGTKLTKYMKGTESPSCGGNCDECE